MAPIKRPAAATKEAASKKQNSGVSKKLAAVGKVINGAEGYPSAVLSMLGQHLELTLGVHKEDRHEFQERVVKMIDDVLTSQKVSIEAKIAGAEAKVAEADGEKTKREGDVQASTEAVAQKNEALTAATEAAADADAKLKEAHKNSAAAKSKQEAGDALLLAAAGSKEKIESVLRTSFEPLKTGALEPATIKEAVATIAKVGKECHFDASLLTSLPSALGKVPEARGSFDTVVLGQVEEQLQKQIELLTEQLASGEQGRQERAAEVAQADASLETAKATDESAKAGLKEAKTALKDAEEALKIANKSLKQFGPEMKQVKAELEQLKEQLKELENGALADFKELAERSIHPPAVAVEVAETTAATATVEGA